MQKLIKISVLLFVLFITSNSFGQGWVKASEHHGDRPMFLDISSTNDKGFILIHSIVENDSNSIVHYPTYLYRYNSTGELLMQKKINSDTFQIRNIIQLKNDNFVTIYRKGWFYSNENKIYKLQIINNTGDVIFTIDSIPIQYKDMQSDNQTYNEPIAVTDLHNGHFNVSIFSHVNSVNNILIEKIYLLDFLYNGTLSNIKIDSFDTGSKLSFVSGFDNDAYTLYNSKRINSTSNRTYISSYDYSNNIFYKGFYILDKNNKLIKPVLNTLFTNNDTSFLTCYGNYPNDNYSHSVIATIEGLVIAKFDTNGILLKKSIVKNTLTSLVYYPLPINENKLLLFSIADNKGILINLQPDTALVLKEWSLNLLPDTSVIENFIAFTNSDNTIYCEVKSAKSNYYILKIDSNGVFTNHIIRGNVFSDINNNCDKNVNERGVKEFTVTATKAAQSDFSTSNSNGDFEIGVADSGLYTLNVYSNTNYPLWSTIGCPNSFNVNVRDSITIDTVNLAFKPTILCPNMYVDISTPRLRRCFSNIYTVNYKNNGTIASPNTYIDITLDRFLTVNSASKPYTNLGNNVLRFQLGNVDYLTSGSFTIDVNVRCDSTVLGQTHCVEAHIYPDTVCAVANYNGPVISASAQCKLDSVEFKLKNTGGNMPAIKRYIVIEDNLNRLNGTFQLNSGQQKLVTVKADSGKTYGIIAEQDDLFPIALGDKYTSAFIEGCNPLNGTYTTGFVTQFPEFDGEPYRSIDCQQNIGSYDPNDKTGYPIGVSSNHNIEKNTALDYHINFQNTGTDTAFKVVIVDTISKYLDINTIEPGASSHLYTFMRTDSNAIKFIFENIRLIDSNKNEKLSHGFVKFRIQQKPNNANGTKIYNQAEIYFDYNSPIFTNITTHTIGEVYVRLLSATIHTKYRQANIKVYPNPFRENAIIDIQNLEQQKTTLTLYDILGKEVLQLQSNNNQYQINGNALEKGIYLFKIKNDQEEIANGKIVLQ